MGRRKSKLCNSAPSTGRRVSLEEIRKGDYCRYQSGDYIQITALHNSKKVVAKNARYCYTNFILSDESGHIGAKIISDKEAWDHVHYKNTVIKIKVGQKYKISDFEVHLTNPSYALLRGFPFELQLASRPTSVEEVPSTDGIPHLTFIPFKFTEIAQVEAYQVGEYIDLIGVVIDISERKQSKGENNCQFKHLDISDSRQEENGRSVRIALFEKKVKDLKGLRKKSVVALLNVKVDEFRNAISLKASSITVVIPINSRDQLEERLSAYLNQSENILKLFPRHYRSSVRTTVKYSEQVQSEIERSAKRQRIYHDGSATELNGNVTNGVEQSHSFISQAPSSSRASLSYPPYQHTYDFTTKPREPLQVVVKKSRNFMDTNDGCYRMRAEPRGVALIISNYDFKPRNGNDRIRRGTEFDCKHLKTFLEQCYFHVEIKRDVSSKYYKRVITDFKQLIRNEFSEVDALIIAVFSHGGNGFVEMVDGVPINYLDDLVYQFDEHNFPTLKGKPKVFLFQACQDFVAKVETKKIFEKPERNVGGVDNILVCLPTSAGSKAPRYDNYGSQFIFILVDIFMRNAHDTDLETMLHLVKDAMGRVAGDCLNLAVNWTIYGFKYNFFFNPGLTQ